MTEPDPSGALPPTETPAAAPQPDEALRRLAASRLAEHLDIGAQLVARCKKLADVTRGDRLGPLTAAARLMNSNARIAHALAHVALVERRQRTIIERIQPAKPESVELNSKKTPTEMRREIEMKLARAEAARRRERLRQPIDPQEEANLMLQEEDWLEQDLQKRGSQIARSLAQTIHSRE
jgi:hypothetical protein